MQCEKVIKITSSTGVIFHTNTSVNGLIFHKQNKIVFSSANTSQRKRFFILVAGTDERNGSPQELDKYNVNAGSLLFLGDIPGVEVRGFSVDQRTETRGLAPYVPEMILPGYTQGMREVPQSVIHSITGRCSSRLLGYRSPDAPS